MVSESISRLFSKQSLAYWAILIPVTVVVAALVSVYESTVFAFIAGAVYAEIINTLLDWTRDWYEAEKRVEEVSPDA